MFDAQPDQNERSNYLEWRRACPADLPARSGTSGLGLEVLYWKAIEAAPIAFERKTAAWNCGVLLDSNDLVPGGRIVEEDLLAGMNLLFTEGETIDRLQTLLGAPPDDSIELVVGGPVLQAQVREALASRRLKGVRSLVLSGWRLGRPNDRELSNDVIEKGEQQGIEVSTGLISGYDFFDHGASPAVELGLSMALGCEHLRSLLDSGVPLTRVARQVPLALGVDQDIFVQMAKLRAARWLWAKLATVVGCEQQARVYALTQRQFPTDGWSNFVRVTASVLAAVCAGADSIVIRPPEEPDDAPRRLWRNVHHLLTEESYLGVVDDPAAGSFCVEQVTEDLARSGWSVFRQVEAAGGFFRSLDDGVVNDLLGGRK